MSESEKGIQVEKGNYARIHNRILEELARMKLSGREARVIMALWRLTYGWRKKKRPLKLNQFRELTKLPIKKISETLIRLADRNIIKKDIPKKGDKTLITYGFNKYFSTWKDIPKKRDIPKKGDTLSPKKGTSLPKKGDKNSRESAPDASSRGPKDNNKDNFKDKNLYVAIKNRENIYISICDYLNEKTGKRFSWKNKQTQGHINARLKEGFSLADFIKVIDNKVAAWLNNRRMFPFLRPQTLFCTKFEAYLNDTPRPGPGIPEPKTYAQCQDLERRLMAKWLIESEGGIIEKNDQGDNQKACNSFLIE